MEVNVHHREQKSDFFKQIFYPTRLKSLHLVMNKTTLIYVIFSLDFFILNIKQDSISVSDLSVITKFLVMKLMVSMTCPSFSTRKTFLILQKLC